MLKTVKTRLLAVVMAMVLIVGCIPAITLDVVADAAPAVYYLKGGATDGDGSADAPFGTTTEVVNAIKDAGQNVAGNVITVKVIKSDSNVGFGEANALYVNPYSYTSGGSTYSGVLLHDATIVYESADPENRASMFSADATAYYFTFLRLGGPTVFRNIDLRINRTSGQWLEFFSNGYSATYENVKFQYKDGSTVPASVIAIYQGGYQHNNGTQMGEGGTFIVDAATLARVDYVVASGNSDNNAWYYSNGYQDYDEDVKVVLTGDSIANLRIGGANSGKTIAYKKNLNIVLNGTVVGNLYNRNTITAMTEGHAMQIIYNGGARISAETSVNLTRYDIFVENLEGAALDTTETTGIYKVTYPEGKNVVCAEDSEGNKYYSIGDTLKVGEADTYNVTFTYRSSDSAEYYVKGGASGSGISYDDPAGTISALIARITEDGYNFAGQEVVVKVIDNGSNYFYFNYENGDYVIPSHEATLVFESYDEASASFLSICPRVGSSNVDSQYLKLGGPTKFKNLKLIFARTSGDWLEMYCGGYDATFENVLIYGYSDRTYSKPAQTTGATGGANNTALGFGAYNNSGDGEGGTLTIDAATINNNGLGIISSTAYINNKSYTDQFTFDQDVKLVIGAGTIRSALRIGGSPQGDSVAYKKNLNLVLNGTTVPVLYSRNKIAAMTDGHALQIIYNNGATIASETTGTYAFTHLTRYDIHVENIAGAALDTTSVAGTYAVTLPEGYKYAIATDSEGNEYVSNDGVLEVGKAGVYNVTFAKRLANTPYYIMGGATGDGTTEETPAGTLSALIAQLESEGRNVAGEEIIVKVIPNGKNYVYYNTENNAKATVPYKATLIFESYDAENPSIIGVTSSKVSTRGDQHLRISGPTIFRNIGIMFYRGYTDWMETYCGGYDVTFENVQLYGYNNTSSLTPTVPSSDNGNRIIVQGSIDTLVDGEGGTVKVDAQTIRNNTMGYISASSGTSNSAADQQIMENDVKIVLGNAALKNELRIGGASSGSTIAYKKNLNIVLNGTTVPLLFNRNYISAMTDGHAMQVIFNNGATIAAETTGTYAINLRRYNIYVENLEGAALDTTSVAGTYSVSYPAGKNIVYYYAIDAKGNYDGTTPIYYANTETITVGDPSSYKVGFVSDVSDIDVTIVNEFMSFSGFANNTEDGVNGTLTPVVAASNTVETDVSGIDGAIVYRADINFTANSNNIISAAGNIGETTLVELSDGGLKIGGYIVAGEFGYGKYGVKITLAPGSFALIVEITKPDGTVIRRGDYGMLNGNTSFTKLVSKASFEDGVANAYAAKSDFTPEEYVIDTNEPVYTGFEANVYNLVTSYDVDAKTTRTFAFTAKTDYVSADETMTVKYNVKDSDEVKYADAVRKNEKTVYEEIDFFEADITGLTPGTTYEYRIGKKGSTSDADWSKVYTFTTEAENVTDFSFITIADTQGEGWTGRGFMYAQTVINEALEDMENPAFIINAGDLVEKGGREYMWEQYFKAMGDIIKTVPHFAVMGNHEYQEAGGPDTDFLFNLHFNHPNNGGEKAIGKWANLGNSVMNAINNPKELAYSYDYGNAHFVVLNSGPSGGTDAYLLGAQKAWLEKDLSESNAQWKIVVVHQPAHTADGANAYFTQHNIDTLMETLGVDLVIQGHAHYNTRTYPMMNREAVRKDNPDFIKKGEGTVYTIVGSTTTNHDVLKDNLNENYVTAFSPKSEMPIYAVVDVTDTSLTYTAKQADGLVVDKVTIVNEEKYVPESLGVQIRIPSENSDIKQGMRFVSSISRDIYDELEENGYIPVSGSDKGLGFGSVIIPADLLAAGEELTKNTDKAHIVPAVKLRKIDEEEVQFTVCLTDILEKNYTRDYSVVPYVTIMVGDEEVTYYGEMLTADVYQIALMACAEDSSESEKAKQYLKENVIDVVEAAGN